MVLDTGSSDLWVNAPNSTFCESRNNDCSISGTYDATSSSTYNYQNPYFNITYADGSQAEGEYATDTLHIGDATLKDFQFGIGYTSSSDGTWTVDVPVILLQTIPLLSFSLSLSLSAVY